MPRGNRTRTPILNEHNATGRSGIMASSKHYGSRYQKARREWMQTLGMYPACWLCGQEIDTTLHHYSRDSFELDHVYPVSERPDLACDPQWFRPAHKKCNASRKAHGWSADEFRQHHTVNTTQPVQLDTMQLANMMNTSTNTKINNTFDDDAYPIGVVPRVRRDRLVQSDKTVLDEATKKSKVPLSLKAKKNVDPMPVLVSRDWSCAHVTSPCGHCRQFGRNRRMEYNNWKDRHPELNTP